MKIQVGDSLPSRWPSKKNAASSSNCSNVALAFVTSMFHSTWTGCGYVPSNSTRAGAMILTQSFYTTQLTDARWCSPPVVALYSAISSGCWWCRWMPAVSLCDIFCFLGWIMATSACLNSLSECIRCISILKTQISFIDLWSDSYWQSYVQERMNKLFQGLLKSVIVNSTMQDHHYYRYKERTLALFHNGWLL